MDRAFQGSGVSTAGACLKQAVKCGEVVLGCLEVKVIDPLLFKQADNTFTLPAREFTEAHAEVAVVSVHRCLPARFWIG